MFSHQPLNAPSAAARLAALRDLPRPTDAPSPVYVNNHIHTTFSFSPYSPTLAVYKAREAGLPTAGIMDHDSVAGALEFAQAGDIWGVATTQGIECRVTLAGTPYENTLVNNPDQRGNIYASMHGLPAPSLARVDAFFAPLRAARERRNRHMTQRLNALLAPLGLELNYEDDIRSISQAAHGGTVTERHICMAASQAMLRHFGCGDALITALRDGLAIAPSSRIEAYLRDEANAYAAYDLLGLLKSALVPRFFIAATDECPSLADFMRVCRDAGGIAAYPYLGDIGDSVTGDKAAQAFEDAFLDELMRFLRDAGFDAITYMPTRNTAAQLSRLQALCRTHGFFEISGEDINSPRQSFICPALENPAFAHLRTATWALIGHERAAGDDLADGMFSAQTKARLPDLQARIEAFAQRGIQSLQRHG